MRETAIKNTKKEGKTCMICEHTEPWHSLVCPKVTGCHCLECEMLLPRHYPGCSIGQRDGFYGWGLSRWNQKEVEEIYNQHMKARLAQRVTGEHE